MSPLRACWRLLAPLLALVSVLSAGLISAAPASAAMVTSASSAAAACNSSVTAVVVALQPENRVKGFLPAGPSRTEVPTSVSPNSVRENGVFLRLLASGVTVYVNGDPVNLVDPNGHKACHGSEGCDAAVTNNVDSQPSIVTSTPSPHNGGYSYKDPGFGGAQSQGYDFSVPQISGGGSVQISLFIAARESCVVFSLGPCLAGDNRTFDPRAPTGKNRASIVIDYDTGEATLVINPSCDPSHTECHDAFPVTFGAGNSGSSENDLTVGTARVGKGVVVVIGTDFHESVFTPPLVGDPGISDTIALAVSPAGEVHGYVLGLGYPSVEIYHRSSSTPGQIQTLYQAPEGGCGPTRLYGFAPRFGAF